MSKHELKCNQCGHVKYIVLTRGEQALLEYYGNNTPLPRLKPKPKLNVKVVAERLVKRGLLRKHPTEQTYKITNEGLRLIPDDMPF